MSSWYRMHHHEDANDVIGFASRFCALISFSLSKQKVLEDVQNKSNNNNFIVHHRQEGDGDVGFDCGPVWLRCGGATWRNDGKFEHENTRIVILPDRFVPAVDSFHSGGSLLALLHARSGA
jgi:hypothetical protein